MTDQTAGSNAPAEVIPNVTNFHNGSEVGELAVTPSTPPSALKDLPISTRLYEHFHSDLVTPRGICFENFENPPNPGISVVDTEAIGLPLSHREEIILINRSIEFEDPSCKDEDEVRTHYTIPWNAVSFKNPAFGEYIREAADHVIANLHVSQWCGPENVKIHFQGLVLQPPCASNESFKMTSQKENALGIMVIVLPTAHTGGKVTFLSEGTTIRRRTAKSSSFGCSILSWLHTPNIDVDLGPIESGCRVMLVYDLVAANKVTFPSVESTQNNLRLFGDTLSDFRKYPEASGEIPGLFAYILKDTTGRLRTNDFSAFDPHDKDVAAALMELCGQKNILFFLANIEMEVSKNGLSNIGIDSDLGVEIDIIVPDSIRLNEIYDTDATQMARGFKIGPGNLLNHPPTAFQDWMNDKGDNEAENLTCHGVAVLFIVYRCYPAILLNLHNDIQVDAGHWLETAMQEVEANPNCLPLAKEQLKYGCRYVTKQFVAWQDGTKNFAEQPFGDSDISNVIKASLLTGELDLSFNMESLSWESFSDIGAFIAKYGFPAVERTLSIGISKLPHISSRRHVLNELDIAFVAASPVEDPGTNVTKELMAVWREKQALDALRDCVCETNDDARCLVLMAGKYGPFFMVNKILPAIQTRIKSQDRIKSTDLVLHFLSHLAFYNKNLSLGRDAVHIGHRTLVPNILPLWLRGRIETSTERRRTINNAPASRSPDEEPRWKQIAQLICHCLEYDLHWEIDKIIVPLLKEEASRYAADCVDDFDLIYMPLLRRLLELIDDLQSMMDKRRHQVKDVYEYHSNKLIRKFFRKLTRSYLKKLHSPEPPLPDNPTNWVKDKRGCKDSSCRECRRLDRFLQDQNRRRGEFKVNTQQRKHIEQRFGGLIKVKMGYVAVNTADAEFSFRISPDPYPGLLVIEKSHQDFENTIAAWAEQCNAAIEQIHEDFVRTGASDLIGDTVEMMDALKEMIEVKLALAKSSVELCMAESQ